MDKNDDISDVKIEIKETECKDVSSLKTIDDYIAFLTKLNLDDEFTICFKTIKEAGIITLFL